MIHQHIQRAFLLLEQSRYDLAEQELRRAIAMDPDEARPYGLLAGCIVMTGNKERLHEVEEHARRAITLKPDWSYPHFVLGQAHLAAHRYRDAREEVDEAIRLDPDRADHFGLLAAIYLQTQRWQEAIEAAERGLAIEAQHETCTDLRSVALTKLGRREEAAGAIGEALRRNPQNADAHANQGWNMLHRGEYRQALEHFREALRIDPENQWARSGMVEALKARNPVYRVLLAWAFWLLKMDSRVRIAVIIGLYIVYRFMGVVAERNPSLAPFVQPFIILYITFAILTWVGEPLFDLMLRFSRFGRHALSRRQRLASTWFAALGSAAIVLLVIHHGRRDLQAGGALLRDPDPAGNAHLRHIRPAPAADAHAHRRRHGARRGAVAGDGAARTGEPVHDAQSHLSPQLHRVRLHRRGRRGETADGVMWRQPETRPCSPPASDPSEGSYPCSAAR